jgi:DNA-binding transcriptional LysR family regulator
MIGGAPEALLERRADLALTPRVPPGFTGESLMRLAFVPVASPNHPLFKLGRRATMNDLRKHRQLVVRDTSIKRDKRGTFLEAEQRWTFGDMATSIQAARMGFGFARYPEEKIREEVAAGELKVLPLQGGGDMYGEIYLVLADPEGAGPGIRRLAEILREDVRSESDKPRPGARKMKASSPMGQASH